jgi:hypothetical protein
LREQDLTEQRAIDLVRARLQAQGWSLRATPRHQKGYDIEASRNGRTLRLEVKARSVGDNSGFKSVDADRRARQQAESYRIHYLSPAQAQLADVFVCVAVPSDERIHFLCLPRAAWPAFRTPGAPARTDGKVPFGIDFEVATGRKVSTRARLDRAAYARFLDEAGWGQLDVEGNDRHQS